MKVCFETFGCRLSRAEALQQEADYLAAGWEVTKLHSDADLIVIRGCSVTARAQAGCERLIAHIARKYPLVKIRVVGCLKSKDPTHHASQTGKAKSFGGKTLVEPSAEAVGKAVPSRTARAYLKVQDGCNGKCSFCIVPQFRGQSVSVPYTELLDKAKRFVDAGYHEIVVTGCNLSLYASEGHRLAELVDALARVDSSCRVRVGSIEPGNAADELVDAMTANENICRFLHVPVQSGANRILSDMKRPYLIQDVDELVRKALKALPKIGIGCDLMVGYPGETDVDFLATKGVIKRLSVSNVHVFPYSERPGTLAAGLPHAVPESVRRERAHELAAVARTARAQLAKGYMGHNVSIVIESESKKMGWTGEYFACAITSGRKLDEIRRKSLVKVHVTDVEGDILNGVLLDSAPLKKL